MLSDYNEVFAYLPIEETIYKYRKQYYKAIDSCHNNGNVNIFINFMLKVVKETIINTTQKKLNNNQEKILEIINKNPNITRNELAKIIGITSDGVKYNLDKLKKENIIQRIGPDKGGYWKITR